MSDLHVEVVQCTSLLGDVGANRRTMEKRARETAHADVIVFPELFLTGYSVRDTASQLAISRVDMGRQAPVQKQGAYHVFGAIEAGEDGQVFNVGVVTRDSEIVSLHRKIYLPTYGIFEEGRYFDPGQDSPCAFPMAGWTAGLLVCEDLWHVSLPYLLALQGIDLLIVTAAAPGRGTPTRDGRRFESTDRWSLIARFTAFQHGIYVILCNRVGVEDGLTFAGDSMIVGPGGEILVRAPEGEPATLSLTLKKEKIRSAREAFPHLRDERPALTARGLQGILDAP